jgi:hypothetical protein
MELVSGLPFSFFFFFLYALWKSKTWYL